MDELSIERLGGIGGFGGPGSRVRSRGHCDVSSLSEEDRAQIDKLFATPMAREGRPDEFLYRLTRTLDGEEITVVVPSSELPQAIQATVRDELI